MCGFYGCRLFVEMNTDDIALMFPELLAA